MKIEVQVIANSKIQSVEEQSDGSLKVRLKAKPIEGKANAELVKVLAEYYGVGRSAVKILQGEKGRNKLILVGQ